MSEIVNHIPAIVAAQRAYFRSHETLHIEFRLAMLQRLREAIIKHEKSLTDALYRDLHKSYEEAFLTEISIVLGEIDNFLKHLKRWAAPSKKDTPLKLKPSKSAIITEPLGVALIIAPWNYPVQLLLNPLVGAIAAGCTAILKPSPYVPNVSAALDRLIKECFNEEYVAIIQGHRDINSALLKERYDIIFFTGSPDLGRVVMRAAAENLTPVVLELGGKSPVVVDRSADIEIAAKRIAWGKTLNAGQTCIAPDYLLIHPEVKEQFIEAFKRAVVELHGAHGRGEHGQSELAAEQLNAGVHGLVLAAGVHVDTQLLPLLIVADGAGADALGTGAGYMVAAGAAVAYRAVFAVGPHLIGSGGVDLLVCHFSSLHTIFESFIVAIHLP